MNEVQLRIITFQNGTRRVQFEGIPKCHEYYKFVIAQLFILLLIYCMNGKITNAHAIICTAVQIKNER